MSLRKHFYPIKDKKISGALKAKRERPKSKKTSHSQCTTCTYYMHFTTTLHTFTKKMRVEKFMYLGRLQPVGCHLYLR